MTERTYTEAQFRADIAAGWAEQRRLSDIAELWRGCPYPACRRARRCRRTRTVCIDERRDEFRAAFDRIVSSPLLDEFQDRD